MFSAFEREIAELVELLSVLEIRFITFSRLSQARLEIW